MRLFVFFFCRVSSVVSFTLRVVGSRNAVIGLNIRKCPGVRAKESLASFETHVIGFEFRIASIWVRSVAKLTNVSVRSSNSAIHMTPLLLTIVLQSLVPQEESSTN